MTARSRFLSARTIALFMLSLRMSTRTQVRNKFELTGKSRDVKVPERGVIQNAGCQIS